jgi:hypothetical protein
LGEQEKGEVHTDDTKVKTHGLAENAIKIQKQETSLEVQITKENY